MDILGLTYEVHASAVDEESSGIPILLVDAKARGSEGLEGSELLPGRDCGFRRCRGQEKWKDFWETAR